MLLAINGFALSGGRGYYPGLTTTVILVIPMGRNLLETLCLNLIPYPSDQHQHDTPSWELKKTLTLSQIKNNPMQSVRGLTHRYGWVSRAVRLFPEDLNGLTVIRRMYYASAFGKDKKDKGNKVIEPMAAHRANDKQGVSPVRFQEGKGFWREIHSIIPNNIKGADKPPSTVNSTLAVLTELGVPRKQQRIKALVVGQAGKVEHEKWHYWRQAYLEIPAYLVDNRTTYELVKLALEKAENFGEWLRLVGFEFVVRQLPMSRESDDEINRLRGLFLKTPYERESQEIKVIRKRVSSLPIQLSYWSSLERHFYELLEEMRESYDVESVERRWIRQLIKTAIEAWDVTVRAAGSSPQALKAAVQAQRMLYVQLKKLREEYGLMKEVVSEG
jgi:CRISPR system Cascade subunit CasA